MKKISLSIPKPCHENWDAMTAENKGRFCGSCQKTVIDFSSMNDRQLVHFFKKPAASVCGRFYPDQLERNIEIPRKRIPWVKYFFQFTWPAFVLFLKSCGTKEAAHGNIMVTSQRDKTKELPVATLGVIIPEITLVDTLKKPIAGMATGPEAIVGEVAPRANTLTGDTTVVKMPEGESGTPGKEIKFVIDTIIQPVDPMKFIMGMVSMPRVKCKVTQPKKNVIAKPNGNRKLRIDEIKKDTGASFLAPFIYKPAAADQLIKSPAVSEALTGILGGVSVISTNIKTEKIAQKEKVINGMKPASGFSVYPNPAPSHSTLTIKFNKVESGTYNFSIVNSAGEVVQHRELYVDKNPVAVTLNGLPAGAYFIRFINKRTTRDYTQTLIVK